ARHAAPDRRPGNRPDEAVGVPDQYGSRTGRRRGGARRGAGGAPHRRCGARRLRARARHSPHAAHARERRAAAALGQRHGRDAHHHGGACGQQRGGGAWRAAAAHAAVTAPADVLRRIRRAMRGMNELAVEKISQAWRKDPFQVLVSPLLSAQTKDAVTHAASRRLFAVARTPEAMAALSEARIRTLIYPVSFYRTKAVHVRAACRMII